MRAVREDGQSIELLENGTWRVSTQSSNIADGSFRGVPWGTHPGQAKRKEQVEPREDVGDLLIWSDVRLGNLTCDVVYIYVQDVLVRGKYVVREDWLNENRYLAEYDALKSLLCKKYGAPAADDVFWSNDLWRDDPNEWGKAVEHGHLSMYAHWENGDSRVLLHLAGENYHSTLGIEYASIRLGALEDRVRESALLDEL